MPIISGNFPKLFLFQCLAKSCGLLNHSVDFNKLNYTVENLAKRLSELNPNGSNRNMVMQITNCIPPLYKQKDLKFKLSSPSSTKNLSITFTAAIIRAENNGNKIHNSIYISILI